MVALGEGMPSFGALADRMHVRDATRARRLAETNPVTLIAFDLLRLDGEDLAALPLVERRERLVALGLDDVAWQVPPTYDDGQMLLDAAKQQGLEGIVSKRLSSPYRPGQRSRDWLKFPIRPTGVATSSAASATRPAAPAASGRSSSASRPTDGLEFRGRVGSGIAGKAGRILAELLDAAGRRASRRSPRCCPRLDRVGTVWVEPQMVVDVQFLRLTTDGRLRQPAYRGVRTDLTPSDLEDLT